MKTIINCADPLRAGVTLEIERSLRRDQLRISIVHYDGSKLDIVVMRQDVIDALKAM